MKILNVTNKTSECTILLKKKMFQVDTILIE